MTQYVIVSGPSKLDLSYSLFGGNKKNRREVDFSLRDGAEINLIIEMVRRKDGSGEGWILEGQGRLNHSKLSLALCGYYNSHTGTGHLDPKMSPAVA